MEESNESTGAVWSVRANAKDWAKRGKSDTINET
jgi:hypothetical protein